MTIVKRPILSYLMLVPPGYALLSHLHHVLLPFNIIQKTECRSPYLLLETYSAPGFNSILDRIVCILVRFCTQAINDPMCFPMTATLVGLATTAYAIMSIERARFNRNRLLASVMIFFGNVIGTGVIAPLAWLPIYGWSLRSHHGSNQVIKSTQVTQQNLRSRVTANHSLPYVEPHKTFGIAMATFFGQFLPVAILVSHGPSLTQRNILAAFQYFPITYAIFECFVPYFVQYLNCKTKRGAVDGVRLLYTSIASINAFISYWVWIKWLQTTTSPNTMVKKWVDLFFSFGTNSENPVTYMLMWDIFAVFSTFAYWAWLEDGKQGLKSIFSNSILFGPGAGLALYAMKRESRI